MTERNNNKDEYVRVIRDCVYERDGRTISMAEGEILLVVSRSNQYWWKVIRRNESRTFFAPSTYVVLTDVPKEEKKTAIHKDVLHKTHLQNQQRLQQQHIKLSEEVQLDTSTSRKEKTPIGTTEFSPKLKPQDFPVNNEVSYVSAEGTDYNVKTCYDRDDYSKAITDLPLHEQTGLCKSDEGLGICSEVGFKSTLRKDGMLSVPCSPTKQSSGAFDSASVHTSKSSLNEGSFCSTDSFTNVDAQQKHVVKAASFDVLSDTKCQSPFEDVKSKAASTEELDNYCKSRGLLFCGSRLSQRNRSSSVDFKYLPHDQNIIEYKQGSLDKYRKVRISKDPVNRRRSWVLDERQLPENFKSLSRKTVELDEAIILDVPPKLPPKQKKVKAKILSTSTDNLKQTEVSADFKVQDVKFSRSQSSSSVGSSVKQLSRDYALSVSLQSSTASQPEDYQREALPNYERSGDKPVAFPRKSFFPLTLPQSHKSENRKVMMEDTILKSVPENSKYDSCSSASQPHMLVVQHVLSGEHGSEKELKHSEDSKVDESQIDLAVVNVSSRPDFSRYGKFSQQIPPFPHGSPNRIVFEDWVEYLDPVNHRPYYFNTRTEERRWKPPRKGIHSVAATEGNIFFVKDGDQTSGQDEKSARTKSNLQLQPSTELEERTKVINSAVPMEERFQTAVETCPLRTSVSTSSYSAYLPVSCTVSCCSSAPPNNSLKSSLFSSKPSLSSTLPVCGQLYNYSISSQIHPFGSSTLPASSFLPSHDFDTRVQSHVAFQPGNVSPPVTPPIPPSNTKPYIANTHGKKSPSQLYIEPASALQDTLKQFIVPVGWVKKYDALTQQIYFHSQLTGEKWLAASDSKGSLYFYSEDGSESKWNLPVHAVDPHLPPTEKNNSASSTLDSHRLSLITEEWPEMMKNTVMEGFLNRTYYTREGKKVRKNWMTSFIRYVKANFNSGSTGLLILTKTKEDKPAKFDTFDMFPTCHLDSATDRKTSRSNVFSLRNGHDTELLLQADEKIMADWIKAFTNHEGMQVCKDSLEKEKKSRKGSDKGQVKRELSSDNLTPDQKSIRDKLKNFIRRRPAQDTLLTRGIIKETVFGSTLATLCSKDKTVVPIFVLQCIRNIEKNPDNLIVDGLYRISGNAAQIQKIRFEVAQQNYKILSDEKDVHNLAGALKLFFRELKEPLVPFANYQHLIQATVTDRDNDNQVHRIRSAVQKLPRENYETLKVLLRHLLRVSECESENRMSILNLAIVFGPCLLWPETTTASDLMTDVMLHNRVIEKLLSEFPGVFV